MEKAYQISLKSTDTFNAADTQVEGPVTLGEAIDLCKHYGTDAVLHDEAGFTRGWVHADGTWKVQ